MVQDISTAEKLRILKALKKNSDTKKEEAEKEFEELRKKEEQKKKEQEDIEHQINELEAELNKTEKAVIQEEEEVKKFRKQDNEDDEESLEEITENSDVDEEAEKAAKSQYKTSIEELSSAPSVYNIEGANTTYDTLRDFRNKLSKNQSLSYEENRLFYEMKENIEKVNLNRLETAEEVLDNIVASKYLLKQINKYKG